MDLLLVVFHVLGVAQEQPARLLDDFSLRLVVAQTIRLTASRSLTVSLE
jgi:hypothetical protein